LPIAVLIFVQVFLAINYWLYVPLLAKNVIGINFKSHGFAYRIPASLGALLGSFIIPKLLKIGWRKKKINSIFNCFGFRFLFSGF